MQTRDRTRLDADIYYPDAEGEFPVLLMRQPYGRAIASTVVYAHPSWYAAHGYIVVIQDVRGRGSSAGDFTLFANEIEDGYDAVEWAAQLPRSTGQVGMYGFSYQGMTQLYAAAAKPPSLQTICPSMVAYDLYSDWAYEGGAFCYQNNLSWACQLAAETARRRGDAAAYQALYNAARTPNTSDPVCPRSELLERLAPDSFYHDWLANPDPNADYWHRLSPKTYLNDVDLPMLHIGGWFDTHLRGTWNLFKAIARRSQFPQHLWVGPWAHLPWGRKAGIVDFGAAANSPIDRLQVRWFDQCLKGQDTGLFEEAPICLFEMGTNQWRRFDQLPPSPTHHFFLQGSGLASMSDRAGELVAERSPNSPAIDTFVHDPWRPVPHWGGHAAVPTGMSDRAALDTRTDILTYTSSPLPTGLFIAGEITVELYCTADAPSFDLCATLSQVSPDGSVLNFSQGYLRISSPAPPRSHTLCLQPTCIHIPPGHCLRLSISAASSPAYVVNPGTGSQPQESQLIEARVIAVSVYSGGTFASRVRLSLVAAGDRYTDG